MQSTAITDNLRANSKRISRSESILSHLRGEQAAVESYCQTLEKFRDEPEAIRLTEFLADHKRATNFWLTQLDSRANIEEQEPSSGIWGQVVGALVGTAKLIGEESVVTVLLRGEEHGLNEYTQEVKSGVLTPSQLDFIETKLIPDQRRHITSLKAMIKLQKREGTT